MAQPLLCEPATGQALQLWPQRAAFDPALSLLMVADAHFGKTHTFRRHGLAVPEQAEQAMVERLDALLQLTGARELAFLGDLLHGPWSQEPAALDSLRRWRGRHPHLRVVLVRGNHDDRAGDPPADLDVEVCEGPVLRGPWALVHEPQTVIGHHALAGHLHPGVRLRHGLRLPCFRFAPGLGVLPAFGAFTGLHLGALSGEDRVYALLEEEGMVQAISPRLDRSDHHTHRPAPTDASAHDAHRPNSPRRPRC